MKPIYLNEERIKDLNDRFCFILNKVYENAYCSLMKGNIDLYIAENEYESVFLKLTFEPMENENKFRLISGVFLTRFRYETKHDKEMYKEMRRNKETYVRFNDYVKYVEKFEEEKKNGNLS